MLLVSSNGEEDLENLAKWFQSQTIVLLISFLGQEHLENLAKWFPGKPLTFQHLPDQLTWVQISILDLDHVCKYSIDRRTIFILPPRPDNGRFHLEKIFKFLSTSTNKFLFCMMVKYCRPVKRANERSFLIVTEQSMLAAFFCPKDLHRNMMLLKVLNLLKFGKYLKLCQCLFVQSLFGKA